MLTAGPALAQALADLSDLRVERNLPFAGPKDEANGLQSLDVYAPRSGSGRPILVYVHGGGWRKGDKAQVGLKPRAFADKGFVFVSVNYRLVPAVTYKEQADDVARAIAWIHARAEKYDGDPGRIFLMGHSAGAQLVALVGTDERYLKAAGLPLSTLKGVIPLDGAAYDVSQRIAQGTPKEQPLFEEVFGKDRASQTEASAASHAARGKGIPSFLIFYVAGRDVARVQSESLGKVLGDAGVPAKVVPAEGKTHASLNDDLGKPDDVPTRVVFDFLQGVKK
jgi:acetyl esterase/lipase